MGVLSIAALLETIEDSQERLALGRAFRYLKLNAADQVYVEPILHGVIHTRKETWPTEREIAVVQPIVPLKGTLHL